MKVPTGDYISFSFDGISSSSLGIVRTSNGSRFNQNLLPPSQDKIVQIPGGDGAYYFGSQYGQRTLEMLFAFDSLTEEQINKIQKLFGDKKIHSLVLDEAPYKEYRVKVSGNSMIKYIPFKEGALDRLYKGEGSVTFISFEPFGFTKHKFLDDPYYDNYKNEIEWKDAAKMLPTQGNYDKVINNNILLYNPGDVDTDWNLTIPFSDKNIDLNEIQISSLEKGLIGKMIFNKIEKNLPVDSKIVISSKTNLIEGYSIQGKTGTIYNNFLTEGSFFKIPKGGECTMTLRGTGLEKASIEYYYKFF